MAVITTYATFTAALAALSVSGVARKFSGPPASIGTADLPAMWPGLPRGEERALTFDGGGGWPVMVCDLVIAVEPVNQGTQAQNYAAVITILDGLMTALRAANIGRAKLAWTVNCNVQVEVAGATYWAVVATVEGR